MALTFTEQPTSITGAISPMIYQAYDSTNATNAGYYYQFKVYVWSGIAALPLSPVATINKKPDQFGGFRAYLDIRHIVKQYIERDILIDGTYKPNIEEGVQYVAVEVLGFWDGGSISATQSNIILATGGYNYTFDGVNAYYQKEVFTDRSTIYLTEETASYYLWYDADVVSSIDVGVYSTTPNAITTSDEKIQGVDVVQLLSAAGLSGTDSTIQFTSGVQDTQIDVVYECQNKYGEVLIHYLNKYGVYESMVLNALSRNAYALTNQTYYQPAYQTSNLDNAWSYGVGLTSSYQIGSKQNIVCNTNYLDEEYNEIINQIMVSENILLIDGSNVISVKCTDKAFNEKTNNNDKLIQYTLNFEYSQPHINTIAR